MADRAIRTGRMYRSDTYLYTTEIVPHMRKGLVLIVVILALGYGLYGGLYVAGSAIHQQTLTDTHTASLDSSDEIAAGSIGWHVTENSTEAGLNYEYAIGFRGNNQVITNAGVYATDYDRDGWTDVLAIGGKRPVLFENEEGQFRRSGALPPLDDPYRAAHFFDYNRDGRPDLLLLGDGKPPQLLRNEGGEFVRVDAGFEDALRTPIGATSGDFDGDGHLDLYVIQYANWTNQLPDGLEGYDAPVNDDNGNPNYLYDGNGTAFDRAEKEGIRGTRWSLAVSAANFTGDGTPEIHVANDFNNDVLYRVRANGTYEQVVLPERTNRNGMSSEVADVNGDGRLDLFVTNIFYPEWAASQIREVLETKANGNNLLVNEGGGEFEEKASEYDVYEGGWGWAAVMTDFDNDGDEDLFHTTRLMEWRGRAGGLSQAHREQLRNMDQYRYPVVRSRSARDFDRLPPKRVGFEPGNGRGVARLDYNRDGAMDLVVATTKGYRLYRNHAENDAIQVVPRTENGSRALGTSVYVSHGNQTDWRTVRPFTDFLSQDPGVVHVGVGTSETADVRIVWPDGTVRTFEDVPANTRVTVRRHGTDNRTSLR